MFAKKEISERGLLQRLLGRARTRSRWTSGDLGALDRRRDQGRRERLDLPFRARVARPTVVLAAASTLVAIAAVLRDEDVAVGREELDGVRSFMTDGAESPLFGGDPLAARRSADALRARFAGAAAAQRAHALGAA